jgi:outer membrane murein-binding lipoprotein Lpp
MPSRVLLSGETVFGTAEILILLAAVAGTGTMVGVGGWIFQRIKRLEEAVPASRQQIERLTGEVDQLRDELADARSHAKRLAERADFTERLLTEGRATPARPPSGTSDPGRETGST